MHIDDAFEVVSLVFWIIVGTVSIAFCVGVIGRNMSVYTLPDKSVVTAWADNTPEKYQWSVRDYLLMLMIADEYCPAPEAVDIQFSRDGQQDTFVRMDDDYVVNMEGRLQRYYIDYLNQHVDDKIYGYDYYFSDTEEGRWRFRTWQTDEERRRR